LRNAASGGNSGFSTREAALGLSTDTAAAGAPSPLGTPLTHTSQSPCHAALCTDPMSRPLSHRSLDVVMPPPRGAPRPLGKKKDAAFLKKVADGMALVSSPCDQSPGVSERPHLAGQP